MLRVVYKGGILEPVRSGGIHGLLGSVGTELVDVVLAIQADVVAGSMV